MPDRHAKAVVKPPQSLPELPCACATLRRATRAVTQLYDDALRPSGLHATQYTLLQALAAAPDTTQGRLGLWLALDSTTLSRTLKLLEKERWIASHPGKDQRERHLRLTAAGRQRLESARPHWERAQARLQSALGVPMWKTVFTLLDRTARAALNG